MVNLKVFSHTKHGNKRIYELLTDPTLDEGFIKLGLSWKFCLKSYDRKGFVTNLYGDRWTFIPIDRLVRITKPIPRAFGFKTYQKKARLEKAFKTEKYCYEFLTKYKGLLEKPLEFKLLKRSGAGLHLGDILFYRRGRIKAFYPKEEDMFVGIDIKGLSHHKKDSSNTAYKVNIGKKNLNEWCRNMRKKNIIPVISYPFI